MVSLNNRPRRNFHHTCIIAMNDHPVGGVGELGPHEREGFREESPEQPLSLLINFHFMNLSCWLKAKPVAWGPSEFPFPEIVQLSHLGILGFPMGRAVTTPYDPTYWVVPNRITLRSYGGVDYIYFELSPVRHFSLVRQ
ncbi:hypothetical protein Lepto7375DRAFT_8290 [Leptolyngbya sp. PCC 7375]|nr:hypothetical protein Lepto7375DRAFT_8290 [Leptolyngbya sp. PCC 7375]